MVRNPAVTYDAFLSYASEDRAWCTMLAEWLRNANVRVWFDTWELQPGDHLLARINAGLQQSHKLIAVWSPNYFRNDKVWTLTEVFSQQHPDLLAHDRPVIPLLRADCDIPPTLRNLLSIDFRKDDDFALRCRQLLEALDLPQYTPAHEETWEFREYIPDRGRRGRSGRASGKGFTDEVATLYRLLGYEVKRDVQLDGVHIGVMLHEKRGGLLTQAIVECQETRLTTAERDRLLARHNVAQKKLPAYRWIAVTSQGCAAEARTALEEVGISCITYPELLHELVPLDHYIAGRIAEFEAWRAANWNDDEWFIRPDLLLDIVYDKQPALAYIGKWLGDTRANLLAILGDLGTGKSTLSSFLAYHLARSFQDDPLRHPAPVLIPLREVRKEVSLEGIIVNHFSRHGLPGINFPRFEHLVRLGKVILLFDAFDEMADRVRWEVTQSNFRELRRAAEAHGKVLLTCRTHYFKDRNEQAKLIGEGPKLSEIETDLYRELRQQSGAAVVYLQEFNEA